MLSFLEQRGYNLNVLAMVKKAGRSNLKRDSVYYLQHFKEFLIVASWDFYLGCGSYFCASTKEEPEFQKTLPVA